MDNKTILSHTDQTLRRLPDTRRLGVAYALWVVGLTLLLQIVSFMAGTMTENTGGLGGIHDIDQPMLFRGLADPADIQQVPGHIGSVGGHDRLCMGPYGFLKIPEADIPHGVRRQDSKL